MKGSSAAPETADILIVDDTPANLHVLSSILKAKGHKVRPVPGGSLALQAVELNPPDLILLDIMMPEMDGFEVCRRLKSDEKFRDIPVIFISALDEIMDKVKAFSLGGVDYIVKPFQLEEVEARVNTHLLIRKQKRDLEEKNAQLQELNRLKNQFLGMAAHDLRSPISVIKLYTDLLLDERDSLVEERRALIEVIAKKSMFMLDLINNVLDISRIESGNLELKLVTGNYPAFVRERLDFLRELGRHKEMTVSFRAEENLPPVSFDPDRLEQVINNLISNGIKFSPAKSTLEVHVSRVNGEIVTRVIDQGPGISVEETKKLFHPFVKGVNQPIQAEKGTGLGLAIARRIVEGHGGRIWVESQPGQGSTFLFSIPLKAD